MSQRPFTLANEKGKTTPAPKAIDITETAVSHPRELGVDSGELILGVVGVTTHSGEKRIVQLRGRRSHHVKVGEKAAMATRPHDVRLQEHVARMRSLSAEFDERWQRHGVEEFDHGEACMVLDHPSVGRMVLNYEHLVLPGDPSLHGLHLWTAEPGTPSHSALRALASIS